MPRAQAELKPLTAEGSQPRDLAGKERRMPKVVVEDERPEANRAGCLSGDGE